MRLTLNNGAVIYLDPFKKGDYSLKADLVLITHEHFDHNRTELVTLKEGGKILRASDLISGKSYKSTTVCGAKITAVPAYNKNHRSGCVGFVIEADGLKLYFAGDTSETDYMANLKNIDYAFLPTDGIYNMNAEEATRCAEIIGARVNVPIHTEEPDDDFNMKVAERFNPKGKLIVLPGSEIELK